MPLPYDETDPRSILTYAKHLVDSTLRPIVTPQDETPAYRKHKGQFGNLLERFYFLFEPKSTNPDFPEAELELKASPLKRLKSKKEYRSKERLVLGMIDYMKLPKEAFELSSFILKNQNLLIVFYEWSKEKNLLDYPVRIVDIWSFLDLPDEDQKIIREDWYKIADKVRAGKAHELSEGDTLYLGACTKGADSTKTRQQPHSDVPAKGRAYSLKQPYVNLLLERDFGVAKLNTQPVVSTIADYKPGQTFEELVLERLMTFRGMTDAEIARKVKYRPVKRPKHFHALLTKRMLGVTQGEVREFEKASILTRTVRLDGSGRPKEDISFPAFKYVDLATEEWDQSTIKETLERRFLFVAYQSDVNGALRLKKALFWTMPFVDLEGPVKEVWAATARLALAERPEEAPRASQTTVAHVRPHARRASDTDLLPSGKPARKQCFWLNKDYVKSILVE